MISEVWEVEKLQCQHDSYTIISACSYNLRKRYSEKVGKPCHYDKFVTAGGSSVIIVQVFSEINIECSSCVWRVLLCRVINFKHYGVGSRGAFSSGVLKL